MPFRAAECLKPCSRHIDSASTSHKETIAQPSGDDRRASVRIDCLTDIVERSIDRTPTPDTAITSKQTRGVSDRLSVEEMEKADLFACAVDHV